MDLLRKFFLLFFLVSIFCQQGSFCVINDLPGLNATLNFDQYSGYLNVDETAGTELFYWFVESQSSPSTDPLILWLNGGPGCSSLLGFFEENGPFYVKSDLTLGLNEYSWNKEANMVFLESPHGVGFSKSIHPSSYSDDNVAVDSLQFLLEFFKKYPHLKQLDFWIAGESYAGHYIPTLTEKILDHNKASSAGDVINVKGLLIGNPLTELAICYGGMFDFSYSHQMISQNTYDGIRKFCNFTFTNPLSVTSIDHTECRNFIKKSKTEQGNINPYNVYTDVCSNNGGQGVNAKSTGSQLLRILSRFKNSPYHIAEKRIKGFSPFDPCSKDYIERYLNQPAVQNAIHAKTTSDWKVCNHTVRKLYPQSDVEASMIHYYTDVLFKTNLRILIFSGDFDSVIPATSTLYWINSLNLNITTPWRSWTDSKGQVGGRFFVTNELTFTTIRGSGHEVATYTPMRAYDMYSAFLNDRFGSK